MTQPVINVKKFEKGHWSDEGKRNAMAVLDFVQTMMNEHNFEKIRDTYKDTQYVQHNRTMSDGIRGVLESLSTLVNRNPQFSYDVKQVFVDGDFVIVHSHATLFEKDRGNDRKGLNIIDTWKLENGYLVEHWDAVQALDVSMRLYSLFTGGQINNENGVF